MSEYNLFDYARMVSDTARVSAYAHALKKIITPNSVVLDLGAGTGLMTLLACLAGAKEVIAVEPNEALSVAKELIAENNFSEQVTFYQSKVEELPPISKVDIIVSDLRGKIPLYGNHLAVIKYSKENLLKQTGILLPKADTLKVALVSCEDTYDYYTNPALNIKELAKTNSWRKYLLNSYYPAVLERNKIATEEKTWATINYSELESFSFSQQLTFESNTKAAHGFYLWFESELVDGVSYSCAENKDRIYGNVFFPFEKIISTDSMISLELTAKFVGENYIWRWKTTFQDFSGKTIVLDQSTFFSKPFAAFC